MICYQANNQKDQVGIFVNVVLQLPQVLQDYKLACAFNHSTWQSSREWYSRAKKFLMAPTWCSSSSQFKRSCNQPLLVPPKDILLPTITLNMAPLTLTLTTSTQFSQIGTYHEDSMIITPNLIPMRSKPRIYHSQNSTYHEITPLTTHSIVPMMSIPKNHHS